MYQAEAYSILRANIGKVLDVVLGGNPMPLVVASVGTDGALFRTVEYDPQHPLSEFWIAFDDIDQIRQRPSGAN